MLKDFEQEAVIDRLEGWELVGFLQVPIEQVLIAALDNDWITEDNLDDLLDLVRVKG